MDQVKILSFGKELKQVERMSTKPPFSMTEQQIEKHIDKKIQGHTVKLLINNITMKFYEILIRIE